MAYETNKTICYYDTIPSYVIAFKISEMRYEKVTDKDHDDSYSNDHFDLESSNPADTVKVATFSRNKQDKPNENIKKDITIFLNLLGNHIKILKNKRIVKLLYMKLPRL